jgi:hypothetical protein
MLDGCERSAGLVLPLPVERLKLLAEGEAQEMRFDHRLGLGKVLAVFGPGGDAQAVVVGIKDAEPAGELTFAVIFRNGDRDLVREMLAELRQVSPDRRRIRAWPFLSFFFGGLLRRQKHNVLTQVFPAREAARQGRSPPKSAINPSARTPCQTR